MAAQTLFDTMAGAFGQGPNRPALESFVANSQATNGLRSAQRTPWKEPWAGSNRNLRRMNRL